MYVSLHALSRPESQILERGYWGSEKGAAYAPRPRQRRSTSRQSLTSTVPLVSCAVYLLNAVAKALIVASSVGGLGSVLRASRTVDRSARLVKPISLM